MQPEDLPPIHLLEYQAWQLQYKPTSLAHASPSPAHDHNQEPGIDWDCAELEPLLERIQQAVSCGEFRADPAIPVQMRPSKHIFEVAKEVYRRGIRC